MSENALRCMMKSAARRSDGDESDELGKLSQEQFFASSGHISYVHPLPATDDAAWRLIVPVNTLMQRVAAAVSPRSCAGDEPRLSQCVQTQLDSAGYRHVDQVMEHGEYATRGALLESSRWGVSCLIVFDFFDDEMDGLGCINIDRQRTLEEVKRNDLLPAHELSDR
ncbi:hypothetical protein ACNKHU_06740 [Shigella flexneri]